jgi:uncharacterized SAM-binding protein YcdF (DUF218 family)
MILAVTGLLPLGIGLLLWWSLQRCGTRCTRYQTITTLVLVWLWLNGCGLLNPLYARALTSDQWPDTIRLAGSRPVIVLLGGGTEFTGPRNALDATPAARPKGSAIEKIALVARLYHQARVEGVRPTIIVSGGDPQRHGIAEADDYKPDLIGLGIPADAVIAENRSLNTYQNAAFVRPLIDAGDYDRGHPSWIPTIANFARANENLHEIVGIAQFFVYRAIRRY